jgi:cytochrome c nitrite reductase small subunit
VYAKGYSYLGHDSAACANCHVMRDQYAGWSASSHRTVAACNDCHTPSDPVGKYYVKARNGFWHSFYFTTGGFPEPIRITAANRSVTEGRCRECHMEIVAAIAAADRASDRLTCIGCHRTVGHL